MSHSTHVGFRLPPTCAASVGQSLRCAGHFCIDGAIMLAFAVGVGHIALRAIIPSDGRTFVPALALLFRPPSLAVGVGSHDPESVPLVWRSDVVRSQHTPPRIIPQRGKVTEDSGKPSVNKHR